MGLAHSFVALKVIIELVSMFGHMSIGGMVGLTCAIFLVGYGGYFLVTYLASAGVARAAIATRYSERQAVKTVAKPARTAAAKRVRTPFAVVFCLSGAPQNQVSRLSWTCRAHRVKRSTKPQVRVVAFWGVLGLLQKVYSLVFFG